MVEYRMPPLDRPIVTNIEAQAVGYTAILVEQWFVGFEAITNPSKDSNSSKSQLQWELLQESKPQKVVEEHRQPSKLAASVLANL